MGKKSTEARKARKARKNLAKSGDQNGPEVDHIWSVIKWKSEGTQGCVILRDGVPVLCIATVILTSKGSRSGRKVLTYFVLPDLAGKWRVAFCYVSVGEEGKVYQLHYCHVSGRTCLRAVVTEEWSTVFSQQYQIGWDRSTNAWKASEPACSKSKSPSWSFYEENAATVENATSQQCEQLIEPGPAVHGDCVQSRVRMGDAQWMINAFPKKSHVYVARADERDALLCYVTLHEDYIVAGFGKSARDVNACSQERLITLTTSTTSTTPNDWIEPKRYESSILVFKQEDQELTQRSRNSECGDTQMTCTTKSYTTGKISPLYEEGLVRGHASTPRENYPTLRDLVTSGDKCCPRDLGVGHTSSPNFGDARNTTQEAPNAHTSRGRRKKGQQNTTSVPPGCEGEDVDMSYLDVPACPLK